MRIEEEGIYYAEYFLVRHWGHLWCGYRAEKGPYVSRQKGCIAVGRPCLGRTSSSYIRRRSVGRSVCMHTDTLSPLLSQSHSRTTRNSSLFRGPSEKRLRRKRTRERSRKGKERERTHWNIHELELGRGREREGTPTTRTCLPRTHTQPAIVPAIEAAHIPLYDSHKLLALARQGKKGRTDGRQLPPLFPFLPSSTWINVWIYGLQYVCMYVLVCVHIHNCHSLGQ